MHPTRRSSGFILAVHAPECDFRDWDEITAWAEGIAETLEAELDATT